MRNFAPAREPSPLHTPAVSARVFALLLASLATGTSAWISIVAGTERGGLLSERLAWTAVGLVMLLGAHLIPALTRGTAARARIPALLLWLVCMFSTGYGHATFFLAAQRHAGEARAAAVQRSASLDSPPSTAGRSRDAIARDQARVTQALAAAQAQRCTQRCDTLTLRRKDLSAQLAALRVEADEAQRREQDADRALAALDRLQAREDLARADPVTARAAGLLHVQHDSLDLIMALGFGWMLESVACLGWTLGLQQPAPQSARLIATVTAGHAGQAAGSAAVTPASPLQETAVAGDTGSNVPVTGGSDNAPARGNGPHSDYPYRGPNAELLKLTGAIASGAVRPTVKDIRRFMQCSQRRAMQLRRQFHELAGTTGAVTPPGAAGADAWRPRLVHAASPRTQAA
ncbi:conserved hypothetical protein (plasmid) [Burkholderia vietnamiensis G4]|uniref:Uncharacterized protein n=1 Tax=Burkholderia vietnamiensis (strain G4 / LMG 22486) TaxID=269482 RepID=A4JV31_BURVG|nr:conserved hypothetical protein [Burkholderia vietnamiensis G4]